MVRLLPFLLALSACLPKDWGKRDQALEGVMLVSLATDWAQTMWITEDCSEHNPIIGECGERVHPSIYFPVVIVGSMAISRLLPEWYRGVFQGAVIGAEAATAWDNIR